MVNLCIPDVSGEENHLPPSVDLGSVCFLKLRVSDGGPTIDVAVWIEAADFTQSVTAPKRTKKKHGVLAWLGLVFEETGST